MRIKNSNRVKKLKINESLILSQYQIILEPIHNSHNIHI